MVDLNNRRAVERALRDAFQTDRAKVQLSNISSFGLLELSRQRLQSSFMEANTIQCPACNGKGHIKSFDSNALVMLRTIEAEIYKSDCEVVNVFAHPDMVLHLLNHKRDQLAKLEQLHKCKIVLNKENTVYYDGFALEKTAKNEKSGKSDSPKFKDDEHIESYSQDVIEDEVITHEGQLGFGDDLAPLKVNDNMVMSEAAETYSRNNRSNKFRKGPNNNGGRRKISNVKSEDAIGNEKRPVNPNQQPALIYQPEEQRKRNNNRHRPGKFNDRRPQNADGNKKPEKKSALKSWWDKLIE
jgi:ribonuclease E